jgi:hypothetical protein
MGAKAHFEEKRSNEYVFRPHPKQIPAPAAPEKLEGLRRIVHDFPIVKPKVERIQLSHGIKPEDIKDFVGEKEFLQRYKGIK